MSEGNVERIQIRLSTDGEWYWVGKAGNNEIVASSLPEKYIDRTNAQDAAKATFPGVEQEVFMRPNPDEEVEVDGD